MSVIDTATNTVIATIGVGDNPYPVQVNLRGTRAYVANQNNVGTVSVIDTSTNTVVSLPGVPGRPARVKASAGVTSATVSWQAPAFPGGAPISGYRVTAFPGKKTCATTKTTCEITGLTPGVTYTFGIVARNAIGFSRPAISDRVTIFSAAK